MKRRPLEGACYHKGQSSKSGRGAAWLARLLGVQEVVSSNLTGPTKAFKGLQTTGPSQPTFWSPTGVQTHKKARGRHGHDVVSGDAHNKHRCLNVIQHMGSMGSFFSVSSAQDDENT